jgi:gliding motility-associated-like protein
MHVIDITDTLGCKEITQRKYAAIDSCGNYSEFVQSIRRSIDQTPPLILLREPTKSITCPDLPQFEQPIISDDCGVMQINIHDTLLHGACAGSYTAIRTWTAVDSCGNTSRAAQQIKVICFDTLRIERYVCSNRFPVSIRNRTYYSAGTYQDTLKGQTGYCDTIVVLKIVSSPLNRNDLIIRACTNETPVIWRGKSYSASGIFHDTTTGTAAACDTIFTLQLTVSDLVNDTTTASVCIHDLPYMWNGRAYSQSGVFTDTIDNRQDGCDTAAVLRLTVLPFVNDTTRAMVSALRLPYVWNGNSYNEAGTYLDTINNKGNGCDTASVLELSIVPYLTSSAKLELCEVELPYSWNGKTLTEAGTYSALLKNYAGIDSLVILQLEVIPEPVVVINDPAPICAPGHINLTLPAITLGSDSDLVFTFWLDANATVPLLRPDSVTVSGTYYVKASRPIRCRPAPPFEVHVLIYPVIPGQRYPVKYASPNTSMTLQARNMGKTYLWHPSEGLSDSVRRNPVFNYAEDMEYLILITTPEGCSFTDTAAVRIVYEPPAQSESSIHVPNAWSPNRDGHNDLLRPIAVNIRELRYFRVFNRWGQLVYQTSIIGSGWDGLINGAAQPIDAYTWILEAVGNDNKLHKMAGNALLIR